MLGVVVAAVQRTLSGASASTSGAANQFARTLANAAVGQRTASGTLPTTNGGALAAPDGLAGSPSATSYDTVTLTRRCRYDAAFHEVLYREMMLKLNPREWTSLPRLRSITLTIDAMEDTRLNRSPVPREDLLLHQLALETIAGAPARFFTGRSTMQGRADGVAVTVDGTLALDMLEKLVYMVLPNQIGFEGASWPDEVELPVPMWRHPAHVARERERAARLHGRLYASDLKITNLLLFPDFEQHFEMFEPLRSMQVRIEVEGATSAHAANLLLSGFALPVRAQELASEVE